MTKDFANTKYKQERSKRENKKLSLKDYAYLTALGIGSAGLTADFLIQLTNRLGM